MVETINIAEFERNSEFYSDLPVLFTIKSFDLLAIRQRYLASKKTNKLRTGSVERRQSALGGVAKAIISKGKLHGYEVLKELTEPRGIDCKHDVLALSSENKVFIIGNEEVKTIQNPWFSYIHTVDIMKNTMLVSSSGFDAIFEYDLNTLEKKWEWFAWENGFNKGWDAAESLEILLTRDKKLAEDYKNSKTHHLYIHDPAKQILPTAKRAAFINSVVYDTNNQNEIIATFFHEGAVYSVNKTSGKTNKVLSGLKNPHGGKRYKENFMATSTGTGEVVFGNKNFQKRLEIFRLHGKPAELNEMEWVQNTAVSENIFISIDANRSCFVVFDIENRFYDMVPYDGNLAIQDLVVETKTYMQKLLRKE